MKNIKVENKHLNFVRRFIDTLDLKGKTVVDATLGKANDTVYLSTKVGSSGIIYAFDIQSEAIEYSKNKLAEQNIHTVKLIEDSHEFIDSYVKDIDFAIFNLGYLPGFDKSIVTQSKSTALALDKVCNLLNVGGCVAVTLYTGHTGSLDEKQELERLLSRLNQKTFSVQKIFFFNQKNSPPIVYLIEKFGDENE